MLSRTSESSCACEAAILVIVGASYVNQAFKFVSFVVMDDG